MNKLKTDKQIIFNISGGAGKNIMATAVVNSLKKQCPDSKIMVTTAWKDVWVNNPNIDLVVNPVEDLEFYKNHVLDTDSIYLANDPYLTQSFVYEEKHLIEIWCEMFNIKYDGLPPQLYFTHEEKEKVKDRLPMDKKLFFIQTSGGAPNQRYPISWMRDIPLPLAQKIVDLMNKKGYRTVHLRRENQYALENTSWIPMTIRELICSIQSADKCLFIDSIAQHAAAAVNKKAVVTWIGNKPEIFGYNIHTNIVPNKPLEFRHYMDSYLNKWDIAGKLHECPYDTNDIFDFTEIVKNLSE